MGEQSLRYYYFVAEENNDCNSLAQLLDSKP